MRTTGSPGFFNHLDPSEVSGDFREIVQDRGIGIKIS
jgi:hypothetical protein